MVVGLPDLQLVHAERCADAAGCVGAGPDASRGGARKPGPVGLWLRVRVPVMTPHDMIFDRIDELLARADARLAAILRAEPRGLVKVTSRSVGFNGRWWRWTCPRCGHMSFWCEFPSVVHDMARSHARYCHLGQDHGLEVA